MAPSPIQRKNLNKMEDILRGNRQASMLARSLWEFYNYRVYFTIRASNSDQNNRIRLIGVRRPDDLRNAGFCIAVRDDYRSAEALTHELLHADLLRLGFPKFWIHRNSERRFPSAGAIINCAEHEVMLPLFVSFGYSKDKFLARGLKPKDAELQAHVYFEGVRDSLQRPAGYLEHVCNYLTKCGVSFEPIYVRRPLQNDAR